MLTTRKRNLIALSILLVVSTAVAKLSISSNGLVLWLRNGPNILKLKDSSMQKNDGSATSVVISNSASLVSMQDTHQLTLAAWIKPNSIPQEFPVLISKGGNEQPSAYGGYELILNANADNDLLFTSGAYVANTAGANGSLINNHLGEWIHVAFTIDTAAQVAQFYVNGQPFTNIASSGDFSALNFNTTNNLYIGMPDPAANSNRASFDGNIRQVMVFNRTLSAAEIQKIFSSTKP